MGFRSHRVCQPITHSCTVCGVGVGLRKLHRRCGAAVLPQSPEQRTELPVSLPSVTFCPSPSLTALSAQSEPPPFELGYFWVLVQSRAPARQIQEVRTQSTRRPRPGPPENRHGGALGEHLVLTLTHSPPPKPLGLLGTRRSLVHAPQGERHSRVRLTPNSAPETLKLHCPLPAGLTHPPLPPF